MYFSRFNGWAIFGTEQRKLLDVVITSCVSHEPDDSIRSLELVMLAIIASTASAYSPGLSSLPIAAAVHRRTCASPLMGGFEQKYFSKDGARLALLISDAPSLAAADVSKACAAVDGLSGVVYQLDGRIELVAEGVKPSLDAVVSELQQLAGTSASLREAWQGQVGGYTSGFPVIDFKPKMGAKISMRSKPDDLDYISRHLQIEAVFNRGLKLKKERPAPEEALISVSGKAERVKSFVRWCYLGPQLVRPDAVTVEWQDEA